MSATFAAPPSTPAATAASCWSSSTAKVIISGVSCAAPAGIRFGGTTTAARPPPARPPPPGPAQPLRQPHRQQRMPAQGEEVILRPHPLHTQHLSEQTAD